MGRKGGFKNNNSNNFNNEKRSRNPQETRGHENGNLWSRNDKSHIKFYNCNKFCHYASKGRSRKVDEKVNLVENKGREERTLLLACEDRMFQENKLY